MEKNKYILCTESSNLKLALDFATFTVDNVADLMEKVKSENIEVIFIGDRFLQNVKNIRDNTNAAIIMLCHSDKDGMNSIRNGADDYILFDNVTRENLDTLIKNSKAKRKIYSIANRMNDKLDKFFELIGVR